MLLLVSGRTDHRIILKGEAARKVVDKLIRTGLLVAAFAKSWRRE